MFLVTVQVLRASSYLLLVLKIVLRPDFDPTPSWHRESILWPWLKSHAARPVLLGLPNYVFSDVAWVSLPSANLNSSQSCKQGHEEHLPPLYLVIFLFIWHTTALGWILKNRKRDPCIWLHQMGHFVSFICLFPQAFKTGKGSSPLFSFYLPKLSLKRSDLACQTTFIPWSKGCKL